MKKFKLFSMLAAISLVACFCLCSCGTDAGNYSPVQLSTENVRQYLAFNITVSDCIADYKETNVLNKRVYDLSCVLTITTTRAADCYFEGETNSKDGDTLFPAAVEYDEEKLMRLVGSNWRIAPISMTSPEIRAQIGHDGYSAVSFSVYWNGAQGLYFPTVSTVNYSLSLLSSAEIVSNVRGVVYHK